MWRRRRAYLRIIASLPGFGRTRSPTRWGAAVNDVLPEVLSHNRMRQDSEVVAQLDEAPGETYVAPNQLVKVPGNLGLDAVRAMPEGGDWRRPPGFRGWIG